MVRGVVKYIAELYSGRINLFFNCDNTRLEKTVSLAITDTGIDLCMSTDFQRHVTTAYAKKKLKGVTLIERFLIVLKASWGSSKLQVVKKGQ